MLHTRWFMVTSGVGALLLAGCGSGEPASSTLTPSGAMEISMVDIGFEPDAIEVQAGDEVTFAFTNDGKLVHEALIGTLAEQDEHEAEMNMGDGEMDGMDGMEDADHGGGHEGDVGMLTLEPGEKGEITHVFDAPGEYLIGCHVSGHWDAGMKVVVTVT